MYRRIAAAALLAIAASTAPVAAQDALLTDAERARIEAQLAELDARWAGLQAVEARRAAETEARVREAQARQISRRRGPIEVVGERVLVNAALPAVATGLGTFELVTGDLSFLSPLRLEVYRPGQLGFVNVNQDQPIGIRRVAMDEEGRGVDIGGVVREHILATLPDPVEQWSQGWGWDGRFNARVGFQTLLESTHPDAVRCMQGNDLDACASFLFLDYDGTETSSVAAFTRWYPRGFDEYPAHPVSQDLAGQMSNCRIQQSRQGVEGDLYSVCVAWIVRHYGGIFQHIPAEGAARGSILAFALENAAPGNLERVMALPPASTVGDQLATLAGMPRERLLAEWRESISLGGGLFDDGRPGSGRGPITLLWAGGLALIALRTTRWRLG